MKRRWLNWGMIFVLATLLGLFFATQAQLVYESSSKKPVPWLPTIVWELAHAYVWALFTPSILWLAQRFRFERHTWLRGTLIHLPAAVAYSLLQLVAHDSILWFLFRTSLMHTPSGDMPVSFAYRLRILFLNDFQTNLLTYGALVGLSHGLDYYRKYRERQLRAAQLETQLAQAHLQVLKMQLQPHFLFNTLHAISTLVHKDPEAADRMIARLSDLLRLSLDNSGAQEVTLKQELDFLDRYLEIEKTRFQDRLTVQLNVNPETLDAQVPNLILQPLVENAIRHGIEPHARPGRIELRANRQADVLTLDVCDNGAGLRNHDPSREGVGLSNTRARLQELYGKAHHFELGNAPGGGLLVQLTIPFRSKNNHHENANADR